MIGRCFSCLVVFVLGVQVLCAQVYHVPLADKGTRVKYITVGVNGSNEEFIFDTGASVLSLSPQKAQALMAAGALSMSDYTGRTITSVSASGDTIVSQEVVIRELTVAGVVFRNVQAKVYVSDKENLPLLFGQSAIRRFASYQVEDNTLSFVPLGEEEQQFQVNLQQVDRLLQQESRDYAQINPLLATCVGSPLFASLSANDREYYLARYAYGLYYVDNYAKAALYYARLVQERGAEEYLVWQAECLWRGNEHERALPLLIEVVDRGYEGQEQALELLSIYYYQDDDEAFLKYAQQLKQLLLAKYSISEDALLTSNVTDSNLGKLYYRIAITERNRWNCEVALRYKLLSEKLGYRP